MTETLNSLFRKLILQNECGGNESIALRFSDPDGVLSGKSGWSFGLSQFDTQNNDSAIDCLKACGFTTAEIDGIQRQTIDVKPLEFKLVAHAGIVANFDEAQLSHCLTSALNFESDHGIPLADTAAILACADYVNQYGSQGDGMAAWLTALGRPVTAEDVLQWKLTQTKYGRQHPEDCRRRYNNIAKVLPTT